MAWDSNWKNAEGYHDPTAGEAIKLLDGLTGTTAYTEADTCVSCGAYIPEGSQICPNCAKEAKP